MVLSQLLDLARAQHVDSAVAHVAEEAAAPDDHQQAERGAHAAALRRSLAELEDARARVPNGVRDQLEEGLSAFGGLVLAEIFDDCAVVGQHAAHLAHRGRGGDLTRRVTAHAVCDDEEVQLLVDQEVVFVLFARTTLMGRRPEAHLHGAYPPLSTEAV